MMFALAAVTTSIVHTYSTLAPAFEYTSIVLDAFSLRGDTRCLRTCL